MNSRHFTKTALNLLNTMLISILSLAVYAKNQEIPCWIENPMDMQSNGHLGLSQKISIGITPLELSKLRALKALCLSEGKICNNDSLTIALSSAELFGKKVYYASSEAIAGVLYAYAGFHKPNTSLCPISKCDLNKCEPSWICNPTTTDKIGLLGVSNLTADANSQQLATINNALEQAEFLYGIDVSANRNLIKSLSTTGSYRHFEEHFKVDSVNSKLVPFRVQHQCRKQNSLFSHIEVDHPAPAEPIFNNSNSEWLTNPKFGGVDGAVGSVEFNVASGLVSDQIRLAIRRAIVQLAFEKGSHISENQISLMRGTGSFTYISQISESTDVTLTVRVKKIHFVQPQGKTLKVYVWVTNLD